jgi:discoidin domain receptor family protein 2
MEARIFFSLDGKRYQQTPLYFSLDTSSEDDWYHHTSLLKDSGGAARNVTIPLQNRVGRFVRLELDFASKWLLLSEVYFDSGEYVVWSERSDIWLQI